MRRQKQSLQWHSHKPKNILEPPEWKRQGSVLPWNLWRNYGSAHTLISNFWPPELWEKKKSVVLSHQVCGNLLWQSQFHRWENWWRCSGSKRIVRLATAHRVPWMVLCYSQSKGKELTLWGAVRTPATDKGFILLRRKAQKLLTVGNRGPVNFSSWYHLVLLVLQFIHDSVLE